MDTFRAMDRKIYHVLPNGEDGWKAEDIETKEVIFEGELKEEIVDMIMEKAQYEEPSQVVVHALDGRVQYESSFGEDDSEFFE